MNVCEKFDGNLPGLLLAVVCAALSGCASESEMIKAARERSNSAIEQLDHRPPCCEDLSRLHYEKLSQTRTSTTLPSAPMQARLFPDGRSYFMAVELPQEPRPVMVDLRSEMLGGGRGTMAAVFVPSVIALGGDFEPIAPPKELGLCLRRGWSSKGVGYFSSLKVGAAKARYLVFFTDRSKLGGSVPYDSSATTAGGGFVVNTNVGYDIPRSPHGRLDVWLEGAADALGELPARCSNQ